jgi:hypothetical protein
MTGHVLIFVINDRYQWAMNASDNDSLRHRNWDKWKYHFYIMTNTNNNLESAYSFLLDINLDWVKLTFWSFVINKVNLGINLVNWYNSFLHAIASVNTLRILERMCDI